MSSSAPRRSPRIAAQRLAQAQERVLHNPECDLTNKRADGCCYRQDKRPKMQSRQKKQRDPIENLPLLVNTKEYMDGIGSQEKRLLCFKRYCPSCQEYWVRRLSL